METPTSYNCVDRHASATPDKTAIIFVPEPESDDPVQVSHSQVFGGFSGTACGHRIADSGSRILITMDGYYRGGQLADHKVKADEAVAAARQEGQEVDTVLVWRRPPGQYASQAPMAEGRDVFADEL